MPELPEIETIKTSIAANLGACIKQIEVLRGDIIRQSDFEPEELIGRNITLISRRGKFLILELAGGYSVVVHLGMSGRFYMADEKMELCEPHVHFILHLDNERKLIYRDPRRFGGIWLCRDTTRIFAQMGVEPLSSEFTEKYLTRILQNRRVAIKTLLLNQKLISGLGNIYADEALFAARIKPERPASSLNLKEIKRLHRSIRKVLQLSIKRRGTTFRDYRDGFNLTGENQNFLNVYGRKELPCPLCGASIEQQKIGGRSSHFCPRCQR